MRLIKYTRSTFIMSAISTTFLNTVNQNSGIPFVSSLAASFSSTKTTQTTMIEISYKSLSNIKRYKMEFHAAERYTSLLTFTHFTFTSKI